ncbi:MAG TPA: RHS repeat-associated core domain-containing protein [Verrucomicrobiae bacterium]|nr:RHS repeat-associated core domain-containing protein [Verrucomicrobiae bacterium]
MRDQSVSVSAQNKPLRRLLILCWFGATAVIGGFNAWTASSLVNRTLPAMQSWKTGLEFSAKPTTDEIFRARVFGEPLVPIGSEPSADENAQLATALLDYSKRIEPDDFCSLTDFLRDHPASPWRAALLTGLGLEYYNTAYYSCALVAWREAWTLGQKATDARGKFLADRALCELAALYSRLGRMNELEALLQSVEMRSFVGGATERINLAREALSMMKQQPEISFRCGPLALQSILQSDPDVLKGSFSNAFREIFNSASTEKGFSLTQVAKLSKKIGLNYRMAFREPRRARSGEHDGNGTGHFYVPSVVHWKAGHYAAIVRRDGDRYLLNDLTFGTELWASRKALEDESSGYFLVPPGDLQSGWRVVDDNEGASVWGRGVTGSNDPDQYTCSNEQTPSCEGSACNGMAVSTVHLMLANLQVKDTPVGYNPPVGPPVQFTVRYNHRDYLQQPSEIGRLLGPKWTHDWNESLRIDSATATHFVGGGGARKFAGFDTNTQSYAPNQFEQTVLKRVAVNLYEMMWPDGSKKIFGPLSGANGLLLSQVMDSAANAVTLTYGGQGLAAITDAIGQVTTISYGYPPENPTNLFNMITKVTDPFGRSATFEYVIGGIPFPNVDSTNHLDTAFLVKITDVLGLESQFTYPQMGTAHTGTPSPEDDHPLMLDRILNMTTPYGLTSFSVGQVGTNANSRFVETTFPDGSRERVEYNQASGLIPATDPSALLPAGVFTFNSTSPRNTFYWNRTASASSYGIYSQAKIYHWLHTDGGAQTSGILECTKEPLENRVWFNYPNQNTQGGSAWVGSIDRPTKIGRVLEDGQTQLYTYAYNRFGNVTNSIDPVGRTLSYIYDTNGIDLLEVRQTRAGNNELLFRATYDARHRPLTAVDVAGQTNTFTYNVRGQPLTHANPKGETTTYTYGVDGQLMFVDGPLAGTTDRISYNYDALYRVRAVTDPSGYRVDLEYDDMDRVTRITYPDATFDQFTYDRLDMVTVRDRAGRQTFFEYDNMRQVKKQTDPLGRVSHMEWCRCGQIKSITDPLGRTTSWLTDVQGRTIGKQYADGTQITYQYEKGSSRLKQVIDEKQQVTQYAWNRDETLNSIAYFNSSVPTPGVRFTYDPNYQRITSMVDGTGTNFYSYNPITGIPALGAGALASVDGPLTNDTVTYAYDALSRPVYRAINGVATRMSFDSAGRIIGATNSLGVFGYVYDGASDRLISASFPNGQTQNLSYGSTSQDLFLQRITHAMGGTPVSEFLYGYDVPKGRIASWSQRAGANVPNVFSFGYDSANQLLSAVVTNAGILVGTFAYTYDPAGNRLTEQAGGSLRTATYNALNQINAGTGPVPARTNEWDALDRLAAVNVGNQRTEFSYDGLGRRVGIRKLVNGLQVSHRRFLWCGDRICEERDAAGSVTKRYFPHGMTIESGPNAGSFFYTRDHLGSVRELTDSAGNVRARYDYDPFGRQIKMGGDLESDFRFAGMFWSPEANLALTQFRAYDPELGRWLSRDPLSDAELLEGPNLYGYVINDPVNRIDPQGLISSLKACVTSAAGFATCVSAGIITVREKGRQAVEFAGAGLHRAGSAIRSCFSRSPAPPPSAPPPPAPAYPQPLGFTSDIVEVSRRTVNGIGAASPRVAPPPPGLRDVALLDRRLAHLQESFSEITLSERWWWDTAQATKDWRLALPGTQNQEFLESLAETAQKLFGPFSFL